MRSLLLLIAGLLLACNTLAEEKKVVCYYNSWAIYRPGNGGLFPSDINATLCTHLVYNIAGITNDANLRVTDPNADLPLGRNGYQNINQLRFINPKLKTLIAVGGYAEGSVRFSRIASNAELRENFANNAVKFVKQYGFDGMDLQWSYPAAADSQNYVKLLRSLKAKFHYEGLILSALLMGVQGPSASYNAPEVVKNLDFANIIAFDLHGPWDRVTGINAPLYRGSWESGMARLLNVDSIVKDWLSRGVPAHKLVISVATYGRSFTLDSVRNTGIGAPATQPGYAGPYSRTAGHLAYFEICQEILNNGWEYTYQAEQRVPYIVKGNQWVGYDNAESVNEKVNYILDYNLGGALVYTLDTDDFLGTCGTAYPLLKAVGALLH